MSVLVFSQLCEVSQSFVFALQQDNYSFKIHLNHVHVLTILYQVFPFTMFKEQGLKKNIKGNVIQICRQHKTRMISQFPFDRHCCKKGNQSFQSTDVFKYIYPLIKYSLEASSWVPAPLYSEQKICVQAIWKSQLLNQISYLTFCFFVMPHDKEELKLNGLHLRWLRSVMNHCTDNTFY